AYLSLYFSYFIVRHVSAISSHPLYFLSSLVFLIPLYFIISRAPTSTLFPYTTLFRSKGVTSVRHFLEGADCLSTIGCFRQMGIRSEEHTSELQSRFDLVCRLLLEKKNSMFLRVRLFTLSTNN